MKKFLNLWPGFLLLFGMMAFASCSDDDENNEGNGGNDGNVSGSGTVPSVSEAGITHPVSSIWYANGFLSQFNYSDGVLTGGYDAEYLGANVTINQSPLEIVAHEESNEGGYYELFEMRYYNIQTNSRGAITRTDASWKNAYGYGDEREEINLTGSLTGEYDAEGYLTKVVTRSEMNEYGMVYTLENVFEFTWQDGNLMGEKIEYKMNGEISETQVYTYTYAENAPVNSGIFMPDFVLDSDVIYYAGFWGKTTKNIPTSCSWTDEYGTHTEYYTVEMDGQGRITSLTEERHNHTFYYGYPDTGINAPTNRSIAKKSQRCQAFQRMWAPQLSHIRH